MSDDEMSTEVSTSVSVDDNVSSKTMKCYYAMPPLSTMKSEHKIGIQQGMIHFTRKDLLHNLQRLPTFFRSCLLSSNDTCHPVTDYLHTFLLLSNDVVHALMLKVCQLGKCVSKTFNIEDSPPLTFESSNSSILREIIKIECYLLTLIIQVRALFEYSFQVYSALTYLLPASIVSLEESGYDSIKALSTVFDTLLWGSDDGKAVFYMTFRMAVFSINQRNQNLYHRILQLIITKIGLTINNPLKCMDTLLLSSSQSSMQHVQFLISLHIFCSTDLMDTLDKTAKQKLKVSIETYYTRLANESCGGSIIAINPNYMYEAHLLIQLLDEKHYRN